MKRPSKSIGKEAAIALANSNWWEGKTHREIALFQMTTEELCCPFGVFHEAVEKALDRPVWTHEFGLNPDGIYFELIGEQDAPTFEDILNLIPEEKRVLAIEV